MYWVILNFYKLFNLFIPIYTIFDFFLGFWWNELYLIKL